MVPFAGYEMPIQYAGIVSEHHAVRTAAGLFDVSHMGELELSGEDACVVINQLVTNDLERIENGQAMYTCCCNERGTILDDLIVYKRDRTSVLVVCNASNREKIAAHIGAHAKGRSEFKDISDQTALIALQGPKAFDVLKALDPKAHESGSTLRSFHFKQVDLAGVPCTMARTGYTGEDGVELFCPSNQAAPLFRRLLEVGQPLGLQPAGLGARDTLRLEARLALYGNDIDETTNPLEAGLGWTVKFDKPDFVGKRALVEIKAQGLTRKLVGFEMTGRGIARHGYPLLDAEQRPVGICTSGSPSPTLGKNIGLGYLETSLTEIGTDFFVDCRGRLVPARVVKTPFYRRAKSS